MTTPEEPCPKCGHLLRPTGVCNYCAQPAGPHLRASYQKLLERQAAAERAKVLYIAEFGLAAWQEHTFKQVEDLF